MWTGRQTLSTIEETIGKLHRQETDLDQALRSATAEAEHLREERGKALRELARVKLGELQAGRLVADLDAGERRALQMLEERRFRVAAATEQRAATIREVETAQTVRHAAAGEVETALAEVEAIREAAEATVRSDPAWIERRGVLDRLDAIAQEAEKKARQSKDELGSKQKPYDDDKLFAYLWRRGYGSSRYAASGLVKYVDGLVADFVGYHEARANYAMVVEIPLRLTEHAAARRADATQAQTALSAIERKAMEAAGIEAKERVLADARQRLAIADAALQRKQADLRSLDEQRDRVIAEDEDAAYRKVLETIAAADAQDDIKTLMQEARRTAAPADDTLVARIEEIDRAIGAAEKEIADVRRSAREIAGRRSEVERVRERFRGAGYDHPQTTFSNEAAIGELLGEFLRGVVRSGVLWDLLRAGLSYKKSRSRGDFGAPSFPFPFPMPGNGDGARGGEWRRPTTKGGWSPGGGWPSGGKGGGDDGGGFKTGGSF